MAYARTLLAAIFVIATLAACGTPTPRHVVGEIPPGRGLLTGDKGEFVVHKR